MKLKIILILIAAIFLLSCSKTGDFDFFAECLTDAGVQMFGTDWCPHCQEQKAKFGKSFRLVDYINCDQAKEVCQANDIQSYPTWKIDKEYHRGGRTLGELSSLTGCSLSEPLQLE